MVQVVQKEDSKYYKCEKCGFVYADQEIAEKMPSVVLGIQEL